MLMKVSAAIAVIIRIPYVKILVDNASDFLYSSTDVVIWSAIEPGLAITAANMATLRPLFQAFLSRPKLWGTATAHAKSSGYGHSRLRTRSRGLSGGRKGYMRSGSKGDITLQTDIEGDEVGLKDMISPADSGNEKAGRERGSTITTTTISNGKNDSLRSIGVEGDWDLERGEGRRQERNGGVGQAIGEWPISVTKTVQTKVTSWRVEEDIIPVGITIQGGNGARRQSNSHTHIGATSAGC